MISGVYQRIVGVDQIVPDDSTPLGRYKVVYWLRSRRSGARTYLSLLVSSDRQLNLLPDVVSREVRQILEAKPQGYGWTYTRQDGWVQKSGR